MATVSSGMMRRIMGTCMAYWNYTKCIPQHLRLWVDGLHKIDAISAIGKKGLLEGFLGRLRVLPL